MAPLTRRSVLRSLAAVPAAFGFAGGLDLFAVDGKPPVGNLVPPRKPWNILLHGLHIVHIAPDDAPRSLRLIAPKVDYADHKHSYFVASGQAGAVPTHHVTRGKRSLFFPELPSQCDPQKRKTQIILLDKKAIPAQAPVLNLAESTWPSDIQWWMDLPMPDDIVGLRARQKTDCPFTFSGTLGSKVEAQQLPFLLALVYNSVDVTQPPSSDLPNHPTPDDGNLVFFSEPNCGQPQVDGTQTMCQVNKLLGFAQLDGLNITLPEECCAPLTGSGEQLDGVKPDDEKCLVEREQCVPQQCPSKQSQGRIASKIFGIQIRACMTVVLA